MDCKLSRCPHDRIVVFSDKTLAEKNAHTRTQLRNPVPVSCQISSRIEATIACAWCTQVNTNQLTPVLRVKCCEELTTPHCRRAANALERMCDCRREGMLPLVPLQRRKANHADSEAIGD